jgi:hypothetical protein
MTHRKSFPPFSGYTFMAWVKVICFDCNQSIPIMGIVDQSGVQRLDISISAIDRKVDLNTFKSRCTFAESNIPENEWFHLAIVHQKPRLTASTASLFINGKLVQNHKCGYMGHPGTLETAKFYFGAISGFVKPQTKAQWCLGPSYMFEEVLIDQCNLEIIYNIGFEYNGSWQGSWSKYLVGNEILRRKSVEIATNELHSPLGQLNFVLQQGKPSSMPLVLCVPEENIIFSLSANNVIWKCATRGVDSPFSVFNGAKLAKNDNESAYIYHSGTVQPINPQKLVDSIWKLGGSPILIKIIEDSSTSEELHRCLFILSESIKVSWRIASEMETCQYYEIVAMILRKKSSLLNIAIMDILIQLFGPDESIISNSSALKHLFLDIELWRASKSLQKYYLNQISEFIIYNKYADQNIAILSEICMIN